MDIRDSDEKQKLQNIHTEHPWYGHRRIGWSLGWSMKKTRRLMKKFGIFALVKKWRKFIKSGDQKQEDMHGKYIGWIKIMNHLKSLCPIHPHIVWRSDFTHIIYKWVHLYLATILDDFTKEIVGYALSYSHAKELILSAIEDAIVKTGWIIPEYFHSDQGSEYTSESVMTFLQMNHILISMSTKWSPWQNGAQESYYGKFKLELWDTKQYETREHLILAIHRQISYYNQKRLHTTIRDTPRGFRKKHEEKVRILLSKNTDS
jgi:putative transposase